MTAERRASSLAQGLRSLGQGRLILLLAFTTLALAIPASLVLWPALDSVFVHTLAGDQILRNHPSFAPTDVLEFLYEKRDAIAGARLAAVAAALLGLLVQIFYAGGFVDTLGGGRILLPDFFAGCWRNLWHNVKCFAIFAVCAGLALTIWFGALAAASAALFEASPPGTRAPFAFWTVGAAAGGILFAAFSLLHDFARIARREIRSAGAWRGYRSAVSTLARAWLPALCLFFFWAVAGGAVWIAVLGLEWLTPAVSTWAIALHTLLQLSALLVRSAVRVGAWGSYVALADRRVEARSARHATDVSPEISPAPPLPEQLSEAPLL